MPLEEVSRLLGHASVLVTQKHYAPWVLQRQQRLAESQRAAWAVMGVAPRASIQQTASPQVGNLTEIRSCS